MSMKLLLCVVLCTACAVGKAQQDYAFPDYWQNDYDDFYDNFFKEGETSNENTQSKQTEANRLLSTEIQDVKEETEIKSNSESKEFDAFQDYQIEDNRSNSDEKDHVEENKQVEEEPMPDDVPKKENNEEFDIVPLTEPHEVLMDDEIWRDVIDETQENAANENLNEEEVDHDNVWGDVVEDDMAPLPVPKTEDNDDIVEETRDSLNENNQNFGDQQDEELFKEEKPELDVADEIIDETNMLLAESDDTFGINDYNNSDEKEQDKSEEDLFSENNDEKGEDTPQKVYADLNDDLDKLFETLDKLSEDNSDKEEQADDDNTYVDNVQDYEEKFGKPYREGVVLNWREEADVAEQNYFDESEETIDGKNNKPEENDGSNEQEENDDYEIVDDSNLSDIFAANAAANAADQNELNESDKNDEQGLSEVNESNNDAIEENISGDQKDTIAAVEATFDYVDNLNESIDNEPSADDDINSAIKQLFSEDIKEPQSYGNDALIDENQPKNEDAEEFDSIVANDTKVEEDTERKSAMVDDLSSAELSDLMTQFAIAHSEDLDVHSEDFVKNIAPVHVTLSVDEPTIITSPNYPEFYPTNNIVDWIFEGPGTGIELNITDFAVNGALGDYLLVKPGGLDESGKDGLIFSYRLRSERRYRFADVNRMFVRFEAKPGFQFMRGFSFSVKLIWPLPELAMDAPEPEAVINPPEETLTLNLAGLTLQQFSEIKEQFMELVADMAYAYIEDHDIDRGLNTTLEVTQITRTAVCNIHWPNYETCVEVTFGVPLQYEEESEEPRLNAEELDTMWTSYIIQEEFASRLRSLGITEYAIPNDRTVLMVWLVIAGGVVISMAMLAFALWRFSCFEDYTRMRAFSDTDSIHNEKRNLDLYPTPHQTLPPLYSENDYKWADEKYDDSTRVDMGGFANKSYIRDELLDLDSDEEVIAARDRNGVISPRDIYEV